MSRDNQRVPQEIPSVNEDFFNLDKKLETGGDTPLEAIKPNQLRAEMSLTEALSDPEFIKILNKTLNNYWNRPDPGPGRMWITSKESLKQLKAMGMYQDTGMILEFLRIQAKTSSLNRKLRDAISEIISSAITSFIYAK